MQNISNFRIRNQRLIALILAGTLTFILTGCKQTKVKTNMTGLMTLESVQSVTSLDELLEDGKLSFQINGEHIVELASRLEAYMDIVDAVADVDFTGVEELKELSEEEMESLHSISLKEVNDLIKVATAKTTTLKQTEDKLTAVKKLNYINTYCQEWIHSNGKEISLKAMMDVIKASVAAELEVPTSSFSTITIPANYISASDGPRDYRIKVGEDYYTIPLSERELWNTVNYIYTLQSSTPTGKLENETYRKALNYAKVTLVAGCDLVKDKTLKAQNDYSYIQENYPSK